ncbi:MAG: hypothetical protein ACRDV9_11180 [Acidimicrobiia bacterium]
MRRRMTSLLLAMVVLAAPIAFSPHSAQANFGSIACSGTPTTCVSLGNNSTHVVAFSNLGNDIPGMAENTQYAVDAAYNPTDLTAYVFGGDPTPDVIAFDFNFGNNGLVGWAVCPANNTGTGGSHPYVWCRGQNINFNSFFAADFDSTLDQRRVACHEIGHTVGLRHYNPQHSGTGSCMYNPANGSYTVLLSTHESNDHINSWY